jgi:hypothetical protein
MTLKHELVKRFVRDKIVSKCMVKDCKMYHINDEWIEYELPEQFKHYKHFSHGLCPEHLAYYRKKGGMV